MKKASTANKRIKFKNELEALDQEINDISTELRNFHAQLADAEDRLKVALDNKAAVTKAFVELMNDEE